MKKMKLYSISCLLAACVFSCKKESYLPPPEGAQVPYTDTTRFTLKEALAQSPATVFYAAWQRSNMDTILRSLTQGKTYFTVLVPDNVAMEAAGYSLQTIQRMDTKDIDSLLMFYTLRDRIAVEELSNRLDNYIARSLLTDARYVLTGTTGAYTYRHHLKLQDGKMMVNGRITGTGNHLGTKDGYIWFLDQPLAKPTKTILDIVAQDSRFSMLLQLLQQTDQQRNQIYKAVRPFEPDLPSFSDRYAWAPVQSGNNIQLYANTVFLPTNDAFKAAGFNTLQDLVDFNQRRGLPRMESNGFGYELVGYFATDTLLSYSLDWGRFVHFPKEEPAAWQAKNVPVFFSNIMNNAALEQYVIASSIYYTYPTSPDMNYYMPLEFAADATGVIRVKAKGAEAPPAKLTEADMPTLMGPVNAIDHILVPRGYIIN